MTRNTVRIGNRIVAVKAVPIGVDYDRIQQIARDPAGEAEMARLRHELGLDTPIVGVGVDRLDYTKGVLERLDALELLLERRPDLRDRMTFVQIGVPSRSTLPSYVDVVEAIDRKVADINARHGSGRGTIRYRKSALRIRRLVALYRLASFCVVSSLHDGMNLVAKEFVAAREDEGGVLVLSEMAGAAQQLHDALLINPVRRRRLRLGPRAGDRHAGRRAAPADARHAARRRRPQRLRVGVRHPRGARAPQPPVAAAGARPRAGWRRAEERDPGPAAARGQAVLGACAPELHSVAFRGASS